MFFEKGVLKICSKFTGEHTCRSVISIKFICKFIEIALWHGRSPVEEHIRTAASASSSQGGNVLFLAKEKKLLRYPYKIAKSVCMKYLTLARPRKLIAMNFTFLYSIKNAHNSSIAKKLFISQFSEQIKGYCQGSIIFEVIFWEE